jgi:ribosomal protein S2
MLQCIYHIGGTVATRILEKNPYIFSNRVKTHNLKIKGLSKQSRELLEKVLSNE